MSTGKRTPGVPIVGIGASAGGLEALREMLSAARLPTQMAFVVVQHLDPNYESMLAQLLDRASPLDVLQCEGGEEVRADRVYIIPPGRGLALQDGRLQLTDFVQPRGLRRPIDDFFISLAAEKQTDAACVILSGTGADGSTGLRAIKEHGGVCVAQKPETARYDGMPVSAVGTGLVDYVKEPAEILDCLSAFFSRRRGEPHEREAELVADHVDDLCSTLRRVIGHDFSGYKRSTLVRRVERRMHVLNIDSASAYLQRVQSDQGECEALFRDLLINVTRFFRDPEMFDALREKVIEPLLRDRASDDDIRVWVPGCSSGEEAYSIAMLFAEAARRMSLANPVQIFASDIDEQMLQIAREGIYPASALADIPSPMRERWTIPHGEKFAISSQIRDLIRFSNHSVVKDPPFSRIDLVSCRNLLIYFDDRLQQSVMPILHYAIRSGGYLFLGPSESIGRFDHLFPALDHHARIFERGPGNPSYPIDLPAGERGIPRRREAGGERENRQRQSDGGIAIQRLVDRYAPPAMVLNQDGAVLAAYGKLSRYFDFPVTRTGGSNAISLAKPGLRDVLGPLVRQARDARKRVVAREVEVRSDYGIQPVEAICEPLPDGSLLLILRDRGPFLPFDGPDFSEIESGDDHMEALEEELRLTRHKLRTAVEELETANEELKSSNEEMMSMNEELQSTNEELSTVNDELKSKVDQLTVANSDLRNFFESTELAVIVLDGGLRIRSFTEAATTIFPLQQTDKGRLLADVATRLDDGAYLDDAQRVAASGEPLQRRVRTRDGGRTLSLRVLPYRTQHGKIDGATLVLTDITVALLMEDDLAAERERLDLAVRTGGIGVWEFRPDEDNVILDGTSRTQLSLSVQGEVGLSDVLARVHPEDRAAVEDGIAHALYSDRDMEVAFRVSPRRDGEGGARQLKAYGRLIGSRPRRLVGATIDLTAEYAVAETRGLMLREMNHRVKNLFAVVSGMIAVAGRSHDNVRSYGEDLRERIAALGRAHSLASPSGDDQQAFSLRTLLQTTTAAYNGQSRIEIEGPDVDIDRNCLSPLALILHEWTTNAAKYGVLGPRAGTLRIIWTLVPDGIELLWDEDGEDTINAVEGSGFGTLLVTTSARQLGADISHETRDGLFTLRLRLPDGVMAR
ncbi:CheR family methyltransferase [Novosphingobium guangzhouense]|uniref:Chemotaxis protein n=1 Tax=Novosphingobium guangzhouense TaxID=1850347 RepID=A0A2K2FTW2_9SPHN|nr:CheR family methyltransferase [Novosphingobium guangzhouense]PNU02223.1 chemotaxis protein [Novosphingobium guangzhouense]